MMFVLRGQNFYREKSGLVSDIGFIFYKYRRICKEDFVNA